MLDNRNNRRRPARVKLPLWAAALIAITAFVLLIGSGIFLYNRAFGLAEGNNITAPDLSGVVGDSAEITPAAQTTQQAVSDPQISISSTPEPDAEPQTSLTLDELSTFSGWDGTERINILVLGNDLRCEEEGPTRTDSMMVISIDPVGKSATTLSLPRDTWVNIDPFGNDRINMAHYLGEINSLPGGGPVLAQQTVSDFLGIEVQHFLTINFEAFRDFINLIEGIQVNVPEAIDDPNYPDECYGYEGFKIGTGIQSLNGPLALKYARTRATANGDIDRAKRQQAVLLAVRQKLLDVNMVPQLIRNSPKLWQSFQNNVKTSLTDTEVIQLALLMQDIPRDNIKTGVIDFNYVSNETLADGRQVLIPLNAAAISELREELFPPVVAPQPTVENPGATLELEGARIAIHNGTQKFGLAGRTKEYFVELGLTVSEIGNADSSVVPTTQIIDYGDHPNTVLYLTQLMNLPPLNASSSNLEPNYDILIILGDGWEVPGYEDPN